MNAYVDGEFDMNCEGLFDNIDELLDFSTDDEQLEIADSPAIAAAAAADGGNNGPPPVVTGASLPPVNDEGGRVTATSEVHKIGEEINISEDWLTDFLDESNFDIDFPCAVVPAAPKGDEPLLFQSFSPVSVLEENDNSNVSSGSSEKTRGSSSSSPSSSISTTTGSSATVCLASVGPNIIPVPARARSKRPRRAAQVMAPVLAPASECESYGEPCSPPPMMRKKMKTHMTVVTYGGGGGGEEAFIGGRRCQHCGIQKTPQWRAGPTGPKTLCNACGVRYKSGRLFPEYRPAASPTFVPTLHSNSHKRVVEMRNKPCQQKSAQGLRSPEYPAAKNCDLLAYI